MKVPRLACLIGACTALLLFNSAHADGPLRERIKERWQEKQGAMDTRRAHSTPSATVSYGPDSLQRFDVYATGMHRDAPVIFMVHGGGWKRGDKGMSGVVDHKLERWGPRGIVFISANYRLMPAADPYVQAEDVARALTRAQAEAARWGADPQRFVLMGHSAGAHLVALLAVSPDMLKKFGAAPPLATVSLDSGTLNVIETMEGRHFEPHEYAFGKDRALWLKTSPWHALREKPAPLLSVCSTRRADACPQADALAEKIQSYGGSAEVLRMDLSHGDINQQLGLPGAYTNAVEAFLKRADPVLAERLR